MIDRKTGGPIKIWSRPPCPRAQEEGGSDRTRYRVEPDALLPVPEESAPDELESDDGPLFNWPGADSEAPPWLLDEPDVPADVPLELDVLVSDEPVPELLSIEPVPAVEPPTVDPAGGELAPALEPPDSANAGAAVRISTDAATASFAVFTVSSMLSDATPKWRKVQELRFHRGRVPLILVSG